MLPLRRPLPEQYSRDQPDDQQSERAPSLVEPDEARALVGDFERADRGRGRAATASAALTAGFALSLAAASVPAAEPEAYAGDRDYRPVAALDWVAEDRPDRRAVLESLHDGFDLIDAHGCSPTGVRRRG